MLENLDLKDLEALAETLPGPHSWTYGAGDFFCCMACHHSFEFGADPVPQDDCTPVLLDHPDDFEIDELIRRYGRAEAERRLRSEYRIVLGPAYPDPGPGSFTERLRIAIQWTRDYHDRYDDPEDKLGAEFVRHLREAGLKLVWTDGGDVTETQLHQPRSGIHS